MNHLYAFGAVGAGGVLAFWKRKRFIEPWRHIPLVKGVYETAANIWQLFRHPRGVVLYLVLILVHHGFSFYAVYAISVVFEAAVGTFVFFGLLPYVLLITSLPISIGGWRVREAAMVGLLSLAGVDAETAFTISVFYGLGILLTRLPLGAL